MRWPVIFLHAFPLSSAMWRPQLLALEGRYPVHALDFPGFGKTPAGPEHLSDFADHAVRFLDGLGAKKAVFVGLSMGGYVAFRIFDRFPERVAGLVLADTRPGADDEAGRARRLAQAEAVRAQGPSALLPGFLTAALSPVTRGENPKLVAEVEAMILEASSEGVANALLAMAGRPDSTDLLARMDFPVLLLFGEQDALTPPTEGLRMLKRLPNGRMLVIPEAGHLANLERPAAFNTALRGFLEEVYDG